MFACLLYSIVLILLTFAAFLFRLRLVVILVAILACLVQGSGRGVLVHLLLMLLMLPWKNERLLVLHLGSDQQCRVVATILELLLVLLLLQLDV